MVSAMAPPFLTSALDRGVWSASSPGRFTPKETDPYLLTYLLTELSPSREAANCAATQELPSILRNPKVHHRVHKSPPLVPILSQIDHVIRLYLQETMLVDELALTASGEPPVAVDSCKYGNKLSGSIKGKAPWNKFLFVCSFGYLCCENDVI
jgi:hypothetical protein